MLKLIVVEGAGDAVDRFYGPALRQLKAVIPSLEVIFADNSKHWEQDLSLRSKRENTIRMLRSWAKFYDKSDPAQKKEYRVLRRTGVDVVFVATNDATHVKFAEYWLNSDCKQIFIEKPLTNDLENARRLISRLKRDDYRVRIIDHYLAKTHSCLRYSEQRRGILQRLERLSKVSFYCLEDHSSADEQFIREQRGKIPTFIDKNGPIENELRQETLKNGLILDIMPHLLAILTYFGHIETTYPSEVRTAKYVGVEYDESQPAEIPYETFAAIKFDFLDHNNRKIEGEAFIGKGISGSKKFPAMKGNVKALELVGTRSKKIILDFRNNTVWLVHGSRQEPLDNLERDPYFYLLEELAYGQGQRTTAALSVDMGISMLVVLFVSS
jgi:predicted dehydrogenase